MNWRAWLSLAVLFVSVAAMFFIPPIPQSEAYHSFADQRAMLGIPNFLNAISNLPFLFVGLLGATFVLRATDGTHTPFIDRSERWPYLIFFLAVALTAFGSTGITCVQMIRPSSGIVYRCQSASCRW